MFLYLLFLLNFFSFFLCHFFVNYESEWCWACLTIFKISINLNGILSSNEWLFKGINQNVESSCLSWEIYNSFNWKILSIIRSRISWYLAFSNVRCPFSESLRCYLRLFTCNGILHLRYCVYKLNGRKIARISDN